MHYDVFISSKSEDYHLAEGVYNFLKKNGLSVFIASKELQKIGESQYADAIDEALDDSFHMIVVASSLNNINSKWVKYEWSTFSNDIKSGYRNGNLLTILSNTIVLKNLPASLRHQQSFHFDSYKNGILDYLSITPNEPLPIAYFNFYANANCQIYKDEKIVGTLHGNNNKPYQLPVFQTGLFRFTCVNTLTKKKKKIKENIDLDEKKDIIIKWKDQSFASRIKKTLTNLFFQTFKWISSKAKTIAIVICCASAIALGWMFIPQIISIFNNEEAKAWRAAKLENTVESYLGFLESKPIRHRDEAISRIIRYGNSESNLAGLLTLQQDSSLLNNGELMDSLAKSIIWWDKDVRKNMGRIQRWFTADTKDYERLDGIEDTVMIIDSIVGLVQKHTQVFDTLEHSMNWASKDVPYSIIQSWDTTFAPAMVSLAYYHSNTLQTLVKKGYEMVESHTAKESYLQRIRILERLCNQGAVCPKAKESSIYEDGTEAVVDFFYYGFPKSQ